MARILVVEDEALLARVTAQALATDGHEVKFTLDSHEALKLLDAHAFDVVLTDLRMPGVDGLQVLARARASRARPEVVVLTAYGSAETAVAAMKAGAADYLLKPYSVDELRLRVRRLSEQMEAQAARLKMIEALAPSLVAESPRMKDLIKTVQRVCRTDATVLLLGESGTGKTQLARYLHYQSPRAGNAFVEVHCAAFNSALLESELFGHARGAFTGASDRKEGHLGRSDAGTLFLDEIGEVPEATQIKLLRFLQDKSFHPVGSTELRRVDVRVVAATNRPLTDAVREGRFREDLYYRLNVFSLELPPLRERREDILPIAERYLASRGMGPERLSPGAREKLVSHRWPGNVRELENALERALILAGEESLTPDLLQLEGDFRSAGGQGPVESVLTEGFDLDAFELELIQAALRKAGGNKAAAARLLGITRRRLYSRLESLGRPAGE